MPDLVNRRAFTLIELVAVLAIIAVLAGLTMAAAGVVRGDARKKATEGILTACHQALELHSAEKGGYPGAARHPGWWLPLNHEADGAPSVAGNPLLGQRPRSVYQDPRLPILYGCPSGRAGLLGSELAQVTGRDRDSLPGDATAYLDFILGFGNAVAELRRQKALLRHGDQPTAPDLLHNGGFKPAGWNDYMLVTVDQSRSERWEPGMIRIEGRDLQGAGTIASPGFWMAYRLLGSAVYDAWGREVFYYYDKQRDAFGFLSAGRDGCLVWSPGADAAYQTQPVDAAGAATASPFPRQPPTVEAQGDDRWAGADNVFVGTP